jgi:hypothetical protein
VELRRDDCLVLDFVTLLFLTAGIVITTSLKSIYHRVPDNKFHKYMGTFSGDQVVLGGCLAVFCRFSLCLVLMFASWCLTLDSLPFFSPAIGLLLNAIFSQSPIIPLIPPPHFIVTGKIKYSSSEYWP